MSEFINGFEIEKYNQHGFKDRQKQDVCPFCSQDRKKKTDKCVSLDWDKGFFSCNHCGEKGQLHTFKKKESEKIYTKPQITLKTSVYSDNFINYVSNTRSIDLNALKALKVRESKEWMPQTKKEENCICFDYYLNNEIINVKYRDARKNFKLYKDAEKIFYNLDNIRTEKECIIVEGEFDVLSFVSAGIFNVVSVPNGFNLKGNLNLDYLDNYIDFFENKETIFIAVDNDDAGRKGGDELIRRLGAEKCKIVNFNDCKDANDYLIKYGKEALKNTIKLAKDVKIDGVFSVTDTAVSMLNSYRNGQKRGETTGVPEVDKAWTWRGKEVNLWTGYQNEGKSLFLNQLALMKSIISGWKFAVFSPENFPLDDFFNDLIETFIGKSCDPFYKNNYMSEEDYRYGMEFINEHFFVIYPEKDFKIQTIFDKTSYLVKKHGIRGLIIDPYNTVEHMLNNGEREDLYISRFMSQLKRFSVEKDLSVNLVAHQLTAVKNEKDGGRYFRPELNKIKGGGTFADKADNCLFVWRPNRALDFKDPDVIFGSQKIKKQKLVGIPQNIDGITYNIRDSRYYFNNFSPFTLFDKLRRGDEIEKVLEEEPKQITASPEEAFDVYDSDPEIEIPF
jgi:twinkle protein